MKFSNDTGFKLILCCLLLFAFLCNGCAYDPGISQSRIVGLGYSDFIGIDSHTLSEGPDNDQTFGSGRRSLEGQEEEQNASQTESEIGFESYAPEGIPISCDHQKGDAFLYEETSSLVAEEPAIEIDPNQDNGLSWYGAWARETGGERSPTRTRAGE